jgi:hypothetical protein
VTVEEAAPEALYSQEEVEAVLEVRYVAAFEGVHLEERAAIN